MTSATVIQPLDKLELTPPIHRITVERYDAMIAAGIVTEDDAVELLEGVIVDKMTKNPDHSLVNQILRDLFPTILPAGYHVSDQEPLITADSQPEPDLMVVRGRRRDYVGRKPIAGDVPLVLEVSDTTLQRDQVDKKRIYARASIPVYWIVNLPERRVEGYTQPVSEKGIPTYREQKNYGEKDTLLVTIDGKEVGRLAVAELLP